MTRRIFMEVGLLLAMGLWLGCTEQTAEPSAVPEDGELVSTVQELRAGYSIQNNVFLGLDFLVTDGGAPVPCGTGKLGLKIKASWDGAPEEEISEESMKVQCAEPGKGNFALVVDNSGSLDTSLPLVKEAVRGMMGRMLQSGSRVSYVRVATNARVISELTDSPEVITKAMDDLQIRKGWTALYDGIRMGNETLGGAIVREAEAARFQDLDTFCGTSKKLGIVAFTDGKDNNSSDEKFTSKTNPGDGLNTTIDDLYKLKVDGITTPIYSIGLGDKVSHSALKELTESTGGRHIRIHTVEDLPKQFDVISDYMDSTEQICMKLPREGCGTLKVHVQYALELPGRGKAPRQIAGSRDYTIHVECPTRANGRVVTSLLTFGNPGISRPLAAKLAVQSVNWVSPVPSPKVLVVLDESHHGEFATDADYVAGLLREGGYQVTSLTEPKKGLKPDDLKNHQVVWFSNPGYPMDHKETFQALLRFSSGGGGLVLQGDDMTYSYGQNFLMSPLTHLRTVDNGTSHCGVNVDNNNPSASYRVTFDAKVHPVIAGLEGQSFLYGDDIDTSRPRGEGEIVLASTLVDGKSASSCAPKPVIVVYDPALAVAAAVPKVPIGPTEIRTFDNRCVDVSGASTANGAQVIQYGCHGGLNQQFNFLEMEDGNYTITAAHSGQCLDIYGASTASDAQVIQWGCHGGLNQRFAVEKSGDAYTLKAMHSGKCIAVQGATTGNAARLIQAGCADVPSQKFQIK